MPVLPTLVNNVPWKLRTAGLLNLPSICTELFNWASVIVKVLPWSRSTNFFYETVTFLPVGAGGGTGGVGGRGSGFPWLLENSRTISGVCYPSGRAGIGFCTLVITTHMLLGVLEQLWKVSFLMNSLIGPSLTVRLLRVALVWKLALRLVRAL